MDGDGPPLLCTVGASPLVVLEAWYGRPEGYAAVHCLTSGAARIHEGIEAAGLDAFFAARGVAYSLEVAEGMEDLGGQGEHDAYEEALFRWYLQHVDPNNPPAVCLAGGFKSMVAGLQKAAQFFGASRVFHVLCEIPDADRPTGRRNPMNRAEVEAAAESGRIQFIDLGPEPGWPQFQALRGRDFEVNFSLRGHVRAVQDEIARRAAGWGEAAVLPFAGLSLWSPGRRAWLDGALGGTGEDRAWIGRLPKVELHCHLGGFATHGDALRRVRAAAAFPERLPPEGEPAIPEGWPEPESPVGLNPYRALGDATGSALLSDPGCLREHCRLLYEHLREERVLYAEIRCSPNNYTRMGKSAWAVLQEIKTAFDQAREAAEAAGEAFPPRISLIIIVTRKRDGDLSDISRHLALAVTAAQDDAGRAPDDPSCRVTGVDLAGFEHESTRAEYFSTSFEAAHRCGLAVTAHAGENDGAEGIWQAVHKLFARRLGHALRLLDGPDLLRTVADRAIGVEMCPFANYQIKGFAPMTGRPVYPLREYLNRGVKVSVNTDNIGISHATLGDNLALLHRLCPGITRLDLLRLQRNAIDTAFLSAEGKVRLLALFEVALDAWTSRPPDL